MGFTGRGNKRPAGRTGCWSALLTSTALAIIGGGLLGCGEDTPRGDAGSGFGPFGDAVDASRTALQDGGQPAAGAPAGDGGLKTDAMVDGARPLDAPRDLPAVSGADGAPAGDGRGGMSMMIDPAVCRQCEGQMCKDLDFDWAGSCYMAKGTAVAGRAKGRPRSDLCTELLACVRSTGCVQFDKKEAQGCYCGDGVSDLDCLSGKANGACKRQIEDAAESVAAEDVVTRLVDPDYAVGAAFGLSLECDIRSCSAPCLGMSTPPGQGGGRDGGGAGGGNGASPDANHGGAGGASGTRDAYATADVAAPITFLQCHMCEQTKCTEGLGGCEQMTGLATTGPGAGKARKDLCVAAVACFRGNRCLAGDDAQPCFCGSASDIACLSGKADGLCKADVEAAAESSDPGTVAERFVDPDFAIGRATALVGCDFESCTTPCSQGDSDRDGGIGAADSGTDVSNLQDAAQDAQLADSAADASIAQDASGDASGTTSDANVSTSDAGTVTYLQCRSCEQTHCPEDLSGCESHVGNASSGPAAGASQKQICLDLVGCLRATHCAVMGDAQPCYCGTASDIGCLSGQGNGVCKAQVEAAAESTDAGKVAERFVDPDFILGRATALAACDFGSCNASCGHGDNPGMTLDAAPDQLLSRSDGPHPQEVGPDLRPIVVPPDAAVADGPAGDLAAGNACPDLDHNGRSDCEDTLLKNPDFSHNADFWTAEFGATANWTAAQDGSGNLSSGALVVTNASVADADGNTMAGARQCIPVTANHAYVLAAQLSIAPGQGSGSGGINIQSFATSDCSGAIAGVYTSGFVGDANGWHGLAGTVTIPAGAQSAAIRLVALKTFREAAFQITFDNVLFRAQ